MINKFYKNNTLKELLEDNSEPPSPIIDEGILLDGTILMLISPPKHKKTFLTQNIALSIAFGRGFADFKIKEPKRVIYFLAEGGFYPNRDRFKKMCEELDTKFSENLTLSCATFIDITNDEDFDESAILAELTGAQKSGGPESVDKDEPVAKKVVIKKPVTPKKKSFLARKATITKKKAIPDDDDEISIQETPKFRLLELVRSLDDGDGIAPDSLVSAAEEKGIPNPRLQMNKMIRRGILYVHLDRVHVT